MNFAGISIGRPIFITSVMIMIVAVGVQSFRQMPIDLYPQVNVPVVSVTTIYPGAGPSEIETLVTKPIEDEISTISGMKRLTSKSLEGISQVVAEFNQGVDVKYAEQQIRDKVSTAKTKIPGEAKEPVIRKMDPSDQPIMTLAVQSKLTDSETFDVADQFIKPRLEQVNNVGSIDILGGRKREIQVLLDRKKLKDRELSVTQVAGQIGASGQNVPTGKVNVGTKETIFRSLGEYRSAKDVDKTLVSLFANENPTRVSDIGRVVDTLEDEKTRVFVNGQKSLFLDVYRQSGSNTLAVVKDIKKSVDKIQSELTKANPGIELKVIRDASVQIDNNVYDVYETIIIAVILTVITVFFFLGSFRSTLITGLSLPISLIGAFILMAQAGFSINIVSLLALTLAIGLLVDDAIVVIENIYRRMELGEDAKTASLLGTQEIQLAVFAITLVVISVFAPVAFMSGLIGQFLKQFGLTIAFSMAISLFVALTIIPMLAAFFAGEGHAEDKTKNKGIYHFTIGVLVRAFDKFQSRLEAGYEKVLTFTLRKPLAVLGASFVVFVLSIYTITRVPATFTPDRDEGEIAVSLDLPPGTNLDGMHDVAKKVDAVIRSKPEVVISALTIGGRNNEPNKASFFVRLKSGKERGGTTTQFKEKLRESLKLFASANPIVTDYDSSGGLQTQPVTINFVSTDQKVLEQYVTKITAHMKTDHRFKDVDSTFRPGKPELQVIVKDKAAETFGISTLQVGMELRAQVEGMTPAKFRENGREYDIRVRLEPNQRNLEADYEKVLVPNVNGKLVKLSDIAAKNVATAAAAIDRQDRGRYIQVTSGLSPGVGLSEAIGSLEQAMKADSNLKLPDGVRYTLAGDSENLQDMTNSMITALGFALLFIYLILSSLYESFVTPITILLALPLALCGAFLALFVTGESLNIFAILGIFLLLGVSGKNSILLIDFARQLMSEGKTRSEALIHAGRARLRPILMTSFALIAGTIPVAIGLNEASKQRTSMGIAIIGGMISSTILTLVVVPAAFTYIDRFRVWISTKLGAIFLSKTKSDHETVASDKKSLTAV